jgi:hypothetical protein
MSGGALRCPGRGSLAPGAVDLVIELVELVEPFVDPSQATLGRLTSPSEPNSLTLGLRPGTMLDASSSRGVASLLRST